MRGASYNQKEVEVCYNGVRCALPIQRIVFNVADLYQDHPDAAGFINYEGSVAKLFRDPDGRLYVDRATAPVWHGFRPLTLKWNNFQ
jgi:hypothetical protein